ncbi:MAG: hypothetical protein ACM3QZ_06705 [Solirubrobacterales bacterium]
MERLFKAADLITSDLLYAQVMDWTTRKLGTVNAILIVPVPNGLDLNVVDVRGVLPPALTIPGARKHLDELNYIAGPLQSDFEVLKPYSHLLKFTTEKGESVAYLVYSCGTETNLDELTAASRSIGHLFKIKQSFDSLPMFEHIQSKLKYQMSFFANTINNIFEPYDHQTLVQLFIEIISEMFLLPSAVTVQRVGDKYEPIFAKGANLSKFSDFVLDAAPFDKNRSLRMFPSIMTEITPQLIGENNYTLLASHDTQLLVPLNIGANISYLIFCMGSNTNGFDYQDKLSMLALSNTLNRSLELSQIRTELMATNRILDRKVFSLTTVYQAAEKIFSRAGVDETMSMALDMLMEIFQSAVSSVVVHSQLDDRFELLRVKSALQTEELSYWFDPPKNTTAAGRMVIDYRNDESARKEFLEMFPQFEKIEDRLKPVLVAHLVHQDKYYGFLTLSDRVTEQPYSYDDQELLVLLLDSIVLALDNGRMVNELHYKNLMLDRQIQDITAIQDVVQVIRKATDLEDFCNLTVTALDMGAQACGISILSADETDFEVLNGKVKITRALKDALTDLTGTRLVSAGHNRYLAAPLVYQGHTHGFLLIEGFRDTVLEDLNRTQLIEITAAILSDAFAALKELKAASKDKIVSYPSLIWYRIVQEMKALMALGMRVELVKFRHDEPIKVLKALRQGGTGLVLSPGIGVWISYLPKQEIHARIQEHTDRYVILRELSGPLLFEAPIRPHRSKTPVKK